MTTIFVIVFLLLLTMLVLTFFWGKHQEKRALECEKETVRMKLHYETERDHVYSEAKDAVSKTQALLDRQQADIKEDTERIRQHFEGEARRVQSDAENLIAKYRDELELLRKYEHLKDAETNAQKTLSEALEEANKLRSDARVLLDSAKTAASGERAAAALKVKDIHEQSAARLNQALKDAGRIISDAEKRAEQIAGEAYMALREKKVLEQAAEAMRNIVEGYGDRYLVPTHSLLDNLAAEYGYDAAGQSLAAARDQTKRMIEQGEAAACDYVEANRKNTAIQFVIHAFNGYVDSILTRVRSDNFGVLEQKIKDTFSLVNKDGSAFRNARILPAYLDARLSELRWAVVVQELAQRDREEQRYLKEQERDRMKAEQERQRKLKEAEKEKELIQAAMEEAEKRFAVASAEQKAESEKALQDLRQQLEEATKKELTIAQQTRKGSIYVISNIGSFGDGVFKIGLTRRSAQERVDELGDASVPFEFDIHAVIETENAPVLEFKIHQQFLAMRINKINMRKEFFKLPLSAIREVVEKLEHGKDFHGTVVWTEKAKAHQFYESQSIENDSEAKEKWLSRVRVITERRERNSNRLLASVSQVAISNDADAANLPQE